MVIGRRPVLLLLNGNIHTMDADHPHATSMALDRGSGRILAVGDEVEIRQLASPLTDTLDLHGATVIPGLIDAHTHLLGYAQARLNVDLRDAHSEDEAVERVRARAQHTPPGTWIQGDSWDKNLWPSGNFPTKRSLDAAVPHHPIALWDHAHHALWVNSEALRRAGIDATTPEPDSGRIGRDGDGEPNGMLFEFGATDLVERVIEPPDDKALAAEMRRVLAELRARGITGVHNIEGDASLRLFQQLHREGALDLRMLLYIPRQALHNAISLGLEAGFGDDYLRFAGIKLFMDGALGPQTAAMLDPYEGRPGYTGMLTQTDDETAQIISEAAGGGVGVAIHAIGDRAVHAALNGIEASLRQRATDDQRQPLAVRRFRLEHVQLAAQSDIERMARLGVVASVQPFHAVVDRDAAERYWGARHRRAYAYQTLRSAGIPLALGSDVPVDTCDPLRVLHAAVMRRDDRTPDRTSWLPDQALTIAQALWGYTVGAAYAGGQESLQGSLTPGKLADMVVLREDPFSVPPEQLMGAEIAATLVGGEIVHGSLE
ncbi:MAG TPA: amidohydrolase family protein [Ktedonobacterales bacterium]